jgi:hypothetical protein
MTDGGGGLQSCWLNRSLSQVRLHEDDGAFGADAPPAVSDKRHVAERRDDGERDGISVRALTTTPSQWPLVIT